MLEKLNQLIKTAQQQSEDGKYNFDELEEYTSSIVTDDEFGTLPEDIQSELYLIDMHEIENLNPDQVMHSISLIKRYVGSRTTDNE